ncbi:hypothetical protein [Faecalibacillus intestinalis]|mgnify:CR=1 FL=1|uniref:hypothetical protein n=1 Tax=Faecalibacillus intestinalis TaxID=1982626 RepID=UPI0022E11F32|nr:hypothetical protein [Faecalibacillus intestinalis]
MFRYYITFIMLLLIAVLISLVFIGIDLNRQNDKDSDDVKLSKLTIIIIIILFVLPFDFLPIFWKTKTVQHDVVVTTPIVNENKYFLEKAGDDISSKISFINNNGKVVNLKYNEDQCDVFKKEGTKNRIKYKEKIYRNIIGKELERETIKIEVTIAK